MVKEVQNKRICSCLNADFYTQCIVVKRAGGWIVSDPWGKKIRKIPCKFLEFIDMYAIAVDENDLYSLYKLEDNTLTLIVNALTSIKHIKDEFFIMERGKLKALFNGNKRVVNFGRYIDFNVNYDFKLITIALESGKYAIVGLDGEFYLDNCDTIMPWRHGEIDLVKYSVKGNWGVYRIGKGIIVPAEMNSIDIYPNHIECVKGRKKGAYNLDGDILLKLRYHIIKLYENVFLVAKKRAGKYYYGAVSIDGKTLLECKFARVVLNLKKNKITGKDFLVHVTKKL